MTGTTRAEALRNIRVGDLFRVEGNHGAPITCLATAVNDATIFARSITHQLDFKFDRETGVGAEDKYSLGGTINSVEPVPSDIREVLLELDRRHRSGGDFKLLEDEIRALSFIREFYKAHPI